MKKFKDFKNDKFIEDHLILEMARINDKEKFPFDVFVYGIDPYGSGKNEHGDPHFHFADKIKGGDWQFSVLIPMVSEWEQNKEVYIYESSCNNFTWKGFKREKKLLIDWLDLPNKYDSDKTNLEFIRLQWNVLNSDNKNVSQIKRIK